MVFGNPGSYVRQKGLPGAPPCVAIAVSSTFIGNHRVSETSLANISEESVSTDDGKENKPIRKLMQTEEDTKEKKKKQEMIKLLVSETNGTNPGISAEQLIAAYDENEDELINNLTKIKTKNEMVKMW